MNMKNPKLKRLLELNILPSKVAGPLVLFVMLVLLGIVIWSGLHGPHLTIKKYFGAVGIGGAVAVEVFRTGGFWHDDEESNVTGRFAKTIGIIGAILALVAGCFAGILIYQKVVAT